jgi:hypothetical protein
VDTVNLYLFLGSLAVIFTAFGFLLHAFCFGRASESATSLINEKQPDQVKNSANFQRNAEKEVSRLSAAIRTLEHELRLKSEELETLRLLALAPDEGTMPPPKESQQPRSVVPPSIGHGRKRAVRTGPLQVDALSRTERGRTKRALTEAAASAGPQIQPPPTEEPRESDEGVSSKPANSEPLPAPVSAAPPVKPDGTDTASWKENLNSVLNILDEMEKEVQK